MDVNVSPPNLICDLKLSTKLLAKIPLKKRLEILFASTIIPSRRQLAYKYDLSEEEVHNVLSHRQYLLQNWQYNANSEDLLSKQDLENAMAVTELLMEWKRRVELNGLQITDAALARKAMLLLRILNAKNLKLNETWWNHFNCNWDYKQFRESENDSLEMEDILNDLEWMFSDGAFRRLIAAFRSFKSGRTGGPVTSTGADKEPDSSDIEEFINISFIKADPNYYNDDQFECEDYELILDEEIVADALRKEIQDQETAKFRQSVQDDDSELQTLPSHEAASEEDVPAKDDIEEKLSVMFNESPPPKPSVAKKETQSPIYSSVIKPVAVQQPRRKPRDRNQVMSLRKDYVRLTASTNITALERSDNQHQLELNSEEDSDSDADDDGEENNDDGDEEYGLKPRAKTRGRKRGMYIKSKLKVKPTTKRKYISRKTNHDHLTKTMQSPEMDKIRGSKEESQSNSEESLLIGSASICDVKEEMLSPLNSDAEEFLISHGKKLIHNYKHRSAAIATTSTPHPHPSMLERNNNITSNTKAGSDRIQNLTAYILDKNLRRSHRISGKGTDRGCDDEAANETILGGSFSYEDECIQRAAIVAAQNAEANEKLLQDLLDGQNEPDMEESPSKQFNKIKSEKRPKQLTKIGNKSAFLPREAQVQVAAKPIQKFKRSKRRTDGSDLTLRKDQVRITLVPAINDKMSGAASQGLGVSEDIQMIYEPYVGDY